MKEYKIFQNKLSMIRDIFINNQGSSLSKIKEEINSIYEFRYFKDSDFNTFINKYKIHISAHEGEKLNLIYLLAKAIEENDEIRKSLYQAKLDRMNKKDNREGKPNNKIEYFPRDNREKKDENRDYIKGLKEEMNVVINEKQSPRLLSKKGLIEHERLTILIKNNLDLFDLDEFTNYLIASHKIETIEIKDIKEILEITKFFIINLRKYTKENDLGKKELNKVMNQIHLYTTINKKLSEYLVKRDLSIFSGLDNIDAHLVKQDAPFIYEFYRNLNNMSILYNTYTNPKGLISKSNIDEIKKHLELKLIRKENENEKENN